MKRIPTAERPYMPDYGIHEDMEGVLTWVFVDEQMSAARTYWVSSVGEDGKPHAAPVWGVWHDGLFDG